MVEEIKLVALEKNVFENRDESTSKAIFRENSDYQARYVRNGIKNSSNHWFARQIENSESSFLEEMKPVLAVESDFKDRHETTLTELSEKFEV